MSNEPSVLDDFPEWDGDPVIARILPFKYVVGWGVCPRYTWKHEGATAFLWEDYVDPAKRTPAKCPRLMLRYNGSLILKAESWLDLRGAAIDYMVDATGRDRTYYWPETLGTILSMVVKNHAATKKASQGVNDARTVMPEWDVTVTVISAESKTYRVQATSEPSAEDKANALAKDEFPDFNEIRVDDVAPVVPPATLTREQKLEAVLQELLLPVTRMGVSYINVDTPAYKQAIEALGSQT